MKATHAHVKSISAVRPPELPAGPLSPSFVLEAQARLSWMTAKQLPHLAQLREAMEQRSAAWQGAALERALSDHLAAVAALRFELLISPGLRAGPLDRDEAAFRLQVAVVSSCTESTWAETKRFLECSGHSDEAADTFSDFILEVRSVQRGVAELLPQLEQLMQELQAREAAAGSEIGRQALAELRLKAATVMERLQQLRVLHDAGYQVQKIGYRLGDESAACRGTLRKLGQALSHGLLERLRGLIALEHFAPGEEMRAAQQARSELQVQLAEAIDQVTRLQEGQRALANALAGMGALLAVAASGSVWPSREP
ncbi:hypothetical protein FN976_16690 [Caenimonas sedimenti]|uniref:Uncharacterized protein n=1 Tax=Caenimonas sedimenti TaxID=2596921 RepID=A0A562ZN78_9BURK|nr:hypothetical protein [Caenimonas sedimenti]TWO69983.1 hypothetical protein FN976_16690 [Caenimonas sedimenti]